MLTAQISRFPPPVVILDEPTVGLDPVTEHSLVETLHHSLEDKTVIWITHHLMGMEKMDRIIFMDDGEIIMQGTHDQLMNESERYRNLYELDTISLKSWKRLSDEKFI